MPVLPVRFILALTPTLSRFAGEGAKPFSCLREKVADAVGRMRASRFTTVGNDKG
jgi:hypothetical protein